MAAEFFPGRKSEQEIPYKITKELLEKKWREGEIDAGEYADACCRLFLEREDSPALRSAYEKVRTSPFFKKLRSSGSFSSLTEKGDLIVTPEIKGVGRKIRALDPALDYNGFVAEFMHSESSIPLIDASMEQVHSRQIFQAINSIPSEDTERQSLFYAALASHTAACYMASIGTDLIFGKYTVRVQGGLEESFWKKKLIGVPRQEGIEFCKEYRARMMPVIQRVAKQIYGSQERAGHIMRLWNDVCGIMKEDRFKESDLGKPRAVLLTAIMAGDERGIRSAAIEAAVMHEAFRRFAQSYLGDDYGNEVERRLDALREEADAQRYITVDTDLKYVPTLLKREFTAALKSVEARNKELLQIRRDYAKLQPYVGKIFADKKYEDGEMEPDTFYIIKEAESKTIDEYVFDTVRKKIVPRQKEVPQIGASQYVRDRKTGQYPENKFIDQEATRRLSIGKKYVDMTDQLSAFVPHAETENE